jgi:hypothetical protein
MFLVGTWAWHNGILGRVCFSLRIYLNVDQLTSCEDKNMFVRSLICCIYYILSCCNTQTHVKVIITPQK